MAGKEMTLLRENNIPWLRTDFDWKAVEVAPGKWDFTITDDILDKAEKNNIKILPILKTGPKWASPAHQHPDKWVQYVNQMVTRYKGRLKYWEVWNEENAEPFWKVTPNPEDYAKLLEITYKEIKRIDPEATVLMGGTSFVPMLYLEKLFIAGGGQYCDIINIHPYTLPHSPEIRHLVQDIKDLKDLMAKYKIEKPIWITEIGWNTQDDIRLRKHLIHSGLKAAGIDPQECTVAMLADTQTNYIATNGDVFMQKEKITTITFAGLKDLSPKDYKVLLLPSSEYFNSNYFPDLERYIKDGGIAIFTGGAPMFKHQDKYEMVETKCKRILEKSLLNKLHMNWNASWTKKGVPESVSTIEFAENYTAPEELAQQAKALKPYLFLDEEKLTAGDKMIPICYGKNKDGFVGCIAATYLFDSELKGGAIVITLRHLDESVTEKEQAQFLPRTALLSFYAGIDGFFWYNLKSSEANPYFGHYGLLRKDLSPKPAFYAYSTLTKLRPPGSVQDTFIENNDVYTVSWQLDGKRTWAVWRTNGSQECKFEYRGKSLAVIDLFGKSVKVNETDGGFLMQASPDIMYITGPDSVTFIK